MADKQPTYSTSDIIEQEDALLRQRRSKIMGDEFAEQLAENRFGIALSGGGIRSAVINLGFLKTLNKFGILKQADYLSTVSGGGYTGAYIQTTLKEKGELDALFAEEHISYMRGRGEYLFPGTGLKKVWNQLTLLVAFATSWIMSMLSPAILLALLIGSYFFFKYNNLIQVELSELFSDHTSLILPWFLQGLGAVMGLHYIVNVSRQYKLDISNWFDRLETSIALVFLLSFAVPFVRGFRAFHSPGLEQLLLFVTLGFVLILLGLFTNPNATSFHRFYRKQLADAFLHFAANNRNIPLHQLADSSSDQPNDYLAPYPIINTCLNLQSSKDPNFQGAKASDYFLLSPLFCGSKLVGYVPTDKTSGYNQMTLPAAVTISAAAVNPGLGAYSNKILSILLTLFNLRLGFWVPNPMRLRLGRYPIVWWPFYFFYELLGRIGTDKRMVNISDGGHIENLGVMELLRRKCKLIVAVDAGADPDYIFSDLENLTVRARNELGIDLRFRRDQIPEEVMRVNPSHGYSKKRFAVADLYQLWEKVKDEETGEEKIVHYPDGKKTGMLIYVKSTITAPIGRPNISREDYLKYGTYKYKIYHPAFPHESTADQFFDPIQWEAYYQLGQFIGADIMGCDNLNEFDVDQAFTIPVDELYNHFDENVQLFGAMEVPLPQVAPQRERAIIQERAIDPIPTPEEEEQSDVVDYEM